MIVNNTGYVLIENLSKIDKFAIYETTKNTFILIKGDFLPEKVELYRVKEDRLPWKIVEGRKIAKGEKVYDSSTKLLLSEKWKNLKQLMTYERYN